MKKICAILMWLACVCFLAPSLHAQVTATVVGTVRDTSGSVVPGATITAKSQSNGFTRSAVSAGDGTYTMVSLPIGPYTFTTEMKGYKQSKVANITLQVAEQVLVDLTLEVGDVSEVVTVTGAASLLQTETSSLGQVVNNQLIVDLPLNGRQFTQLAELTPGAVTSNLPNGPATGQNTNNPTVALGGGQSIKTEYVLDGISNTEQLYNGVQFSPSVDFIQEFKIFSNGFPAEYGNGTGMLITSTRSGTNAFHGVVFEYLRNNYTDARNYFATTPPTALRRNQFGGSVGGPILKNRLFFYANYEGTRIKTPITKSGLMATAAQRSGDLSSLCTATCPHDPLTGLPFPNNQIPSNRLDGATQYFYQFLPLPNAPDGIHYNWSPEQVTNADQGNIRFDYQLRESDTFFGRYSASDSSNYSPGTVPLTAGLSNLLNVRNEAFGYTHIFTPHIVNELRVGYAHMKYTNIAQGAGKNYTVLSGIKGFDQTTMLYPGFPVMSTGSYARINGQDFSPLINPTTTWEIADIVSYNVGRHDFRFGFEAQRRHITSTNAAHSRGDFSFNGMFSGNTLADYLLGLPSSGAIDYPRETFGERNFGIPMFAQDDWKIRDNLTLNVGLRYEYALAPTEDLDQNAYFDIKTGKFIVSLHNGNLPNLATQQVAQVTYNQYQSFIVTPASRGLSNNMQTISKREFAPRVGFALRPFHNDRTVVRGAYGIFYSFMPGNPTVSNTIINVPFIQDISQSSPLATPTASSYTEQYFNYPFGSVAGAIYISAKDLQIRRPYSQEWNLAIQQQLTPTLAFQISYVGNKGTHLEQSREMNFPTVGGLPGSPSRASRRPYPTFGLGTNFTNSGSSIYHGLYASLDKRMSHGLTFLSAYSYSRLIDDMNYDDTNSNQQNPLNPRLDRGLGGQDVHHRFSTGLTYALPIGHGKQFASSSPLYLDEVIGGWNIGGIVQVQSGAPFTLSMESNPTDTEYASRPNCLASGAVANRSIHKWFDRTAFAVPAAGTIGNCSRDTLRGPGLDNTDLFMSKTFSITSRLNLQFRAEAYNLFNHPTFGQPNTDIQSPVVATISSAQSTGTGSQRQLQGAIRINF